MKALSLAIVFLPLMTGIVHAASWEQKSQEDLKFQSAEVAIRCSALASIVWKMYDTMSMRQRVSDYDQKKFEIGIQVTRLASYGLMTLKQAGGAQMIARFKQTGARDPALQGFLALQGDDFVWGTIVAGIYNDQYKETEPFNPQQGTNNENRIIASGKAAQAEFDKRNCNLIGR